MIAARLQTYTLPLPDVQASAPVRDALIKRAWCMRWVKPSLFGNQYELWTDGHREATLTVNGFFHPVGCCEGIGGRWIVEPLRRDTGAIVVRSMDSYSEVGSFTMGLSAHGGILRTHDNQALILESDFWKGRAEFQTPSGEPLIRYRYRGLIRPSAEVEILDKGRHLQGLPWISMLGWCLIVGYL